MPFTTWIRDILGIRKDVIDTKKTKLEITKLEAEERQRSLITPASLGDIQRIDPKTRRLIQRIEDSIKDSTKPSLCQIGIPESLSAYHWSRRRRLVILAATVLIIIVVLTIWFLIR